MTNYVKNFNFYGVDAKEIPCITGEGAPTTSTKGAVGCFYMNTTNGDVYKCTAVNGNIYTWAEMGAKSPSIVQEPGDSETLVMSQKAVTELVTNALGGSEITFETVNSVDEMIDTSKPYVLASTGTVWEAKNEAASAFTNLAVTVKEGYQINGTELIEVSGSTAVEDYIDFVSGDTIRVKGLDLSKGRITLYDANKTNLDSGAPVPGETYAGVSTSLEGDIYVLVGGTSEKRAYIRIFGVLTGKKDDVIVTRNEEITYTEGYVWYDTGLTPDEYNGTSFKTVSSVDEMTDTTKQYVLASTGTIWTFGEVETEGGKRYKNLYDPETMAVDECLNMRINGSGAYTSQNGYVSTPFIPCNITAGTTLTIRIKGAPQQTSAYGYTRILAYPSETSGSISDTPVGNIHVNFSVGTLEGDGVYAYSKTINTAASYLRFVIYIKDGEVTADDVKDLIITANEAIDDTPLIIKETKWYDTMLTPETAGGAGGNYVDLLMKINDNADQISELEHRVTAVESGSDTLTVPSYWEETVKAKTETVKALQKAGGKDCVCFAWAADTHIPDNSGGRTNALGRLMARMLDDCEIPFAVLSGDIGTQSSQSTEAGLVTLQEQIPLHLAPLWGTDRLIMALGNHDGVWGEGSSTNVSGYYSQRLTQEKMWQLYFRGQALDFRREFSDNGSYFYVDNKAQKTRFIVLNSHFAADYTEGRNIYNVSCYGQAQLDWLSDVALDMPEGYGAVITAHVPPKIVHNASTEYTVDHAQLKGIINAYNNKTAFSGSYTDGVDGWSNSTVSVDFSNAKGEIIALFAGHIHEDTVDTETMSCPLITITTAGATVYNGGLSRTRGTNTETSFDVVTINRATKTIYCTRIGAGVDREIVYGV